MKIIEAINKADSMYPNDYTQEDKIEWLSNLDRRIFGEVISHYEGSPETFTGHNDVNDALLVGEPYSEMYVFYIGSQIDLFNGEYTRYNNMSTLFNGEYTAFRNDFNKHHTAKGFRFKF